MLAAGVVTNTSNSSADSPYHESLTCQFPASHVPIASESACTTTLYKVYSTTAEVLVTTLSLRQRAKTAVPDTKDSFWTVEPWPIIEGTQGTGARVRLVGVTGTGVDAELADVIFPVRTATDEPYTIDTTGSQAGSTLLVERTKDTILSLAVLLKAKFQVDFILLCTCPHIRYVCPHTTLCVLTVSSALLLVSVLLLVIVTSSAGLKPE